MAKAGRTKRGKRREEKAAKERLAWARKLGLYLLEEGHLTRLFDLKTGVMLATWDRRNGRLHLGRTIIAADNLYMALKLAAQRKEKLMEGTER